MLLVLAPLFSLVSASQASGAAVSDAAFELWRAHHGKVYASEAIRAAALATWLENDVAIGVHNSRPHRSFTLAHNHFSDMSSAEYAAAVLSHAHEHAHAPPPDRGNHTALTDAFEPVFAPLAGDEIDWVARVEDET